MRTKFVTAGSFPKSARSAAASIVTQPATIRLVSVNAVKTVVMMPMPSVTAKPRTGPVPI